MPRNDMIFDLMHEFKHAQVIDVLRPEEMLKHPAISCLVGKEGMMCHPITPDHPARVRYDLDLPQLNSGEKLLFTFDYALSDGIPAGAFEAGLMSGVRYSIDLDGKIAFERDWHGKGWQSGAVDLTQWAGKHLRLSLLTASRQLTRDSGDRRFPI
jgi:hypothetical protein